MTERRAFSSFKRPVLERKPWVPTQVAPEHRRGSMAPVEQAAKPIDKGVKRRTFRSKAHREAVASIPCVDCGADDGTIVPAHANQGKGGAIKAPDSWLMSLCHRCHSRLDQGGEMLKAERRAYEWEMVAKTYAALLEAGRLK